MVTRTYSRDWPPGSGEIARLIGEHDWGATPLGSIKDWPQSLKTAIDIMLGSQGPVSVLWGSDRIQLYNDAYIPIAAERHPASLGRPARENWSEAYEPFLGPIFERVFQGEAVTLDDQRVLLRRSDGLGMEERHFSASFSPIRDESGAVAGVFHPLNETTGKRRAEAALRESEQRFRAMTEQAEVGIGMTDRSLRFLYVNDAYTRILGRPPEDIVGRTVEELTAPEDWPHHQALIERLMSEGEPFVIEKRYLRPDGSTVWVRNSVGARRDGSGAIVGGIVVVMDVTERRQADERLGKSRQRYRAIVETARDYAIFTTDEEGRIETWPPGAEAVFGWTDAEAIGQMVDITFTSEDRAKGAPGKERQRAREAGQSPNVRWHQRKDGTRIFIEGVMRPLRDEDGELTGFVKVGQDVTERRRTEEQLQLATEAAGLGIFDVDLITLEMHWDARQRVLWGVGPDEIITDAIFVSGIHPDDLALVRAAVAQAFDLTGDRLYAAEYRIRPLDGSAERWIAATGRVHFDGPRPARLVGTVQDITARRRTEARLRELNETLEHRVAERTAERDRVWRLSRDIAVVIGADGVIRAVNPAVRRILGYEPEEVVGRSFRAFVYPDDAAKTQFAINEAAAGRDVTAFEARFRHRNGSLRWISWHTSVEGDLIYANGRDITADKERQAQLEAAESARREADALYRAYFETTAEALFVIGVKPDCEFVVEQVNPAHQAQLGFRQEDVVGKRIEAVLPPALAEQVRTAYSRVIETGEILQYREAFALPGGTQHWDNALVPIRDEEGRITRIFGSSRNVTAQVQAEEALRQSQKMEAMGQLTGGVAHDFNNLLTPILGSLDRLQRRGLGSERDQKLIEGALQSAERARTLVQRLLAFARRQPLQPRAIDVAELIQGMADLVSSTTGPQIRVAVEVDPDLPAALADANQLEMAILNLAVNARDAMPEGGTLRISATSEVVGQEQSAIAAAPGHYLRLSVADTGLGMDEATLARAVEPFFSTKGIGRGTGLGLSMVHGLAAQLGGALRIHSKPGLGTNVELWLPVATDEVSASARPPGTADEEIAQQTKGTVLLVDDEDLVRATAADMLAELGYDVVEAGSADEALTLMDKGLAPDLLVTDHLMPGLSGTELARIAQSRRPSLPVLIVSGYAEAEGIAPELPRLTKPFRRAELAASIAKL